MNGVNDVLPFLNGAIWQGAAVFLRVAAFSSLLPGFGEQSVPVRIKLVLAIAFTLVVAPAVDITSLPETLGTFGFAVLTETFAGIVLGLAMRMFILALQTAGAIAAQSTSLSQVLGGAAADPLPAMGYILVIAGMALAVMMGLHVKAAQLAILSYEFLPYGQFPDSSFISQWGTVQVSKAFYLAFTLAAPFIILSVIYNFALGAINRAMPQLMVAFVGAPLITAGGLALLFIASPFMLVVWLEAMDQFMSNPLSISR